MPIQITLGQHLITKTYKLYLIFLSIHITTTRNKYFMYFVVVVKITEVSVKISMGQPDAHISLDIMPSKRYEAQIEVVHSNEPPILHIHVV